MAAILEIRSGGDTMTKIIKIICDECGKEMDQSEYKTNGVYSDFWDFCSYECYYIWCNHQEKLDEELSNLIGEKS